MITCSKCHTLNNPQAKFCKNCGASLDLSQQSDSVKTSTAVNSQASLAASQSVSSISSSETSGSMVSSATLNESMEPSKTKVTKWWNRWFASIKHPLSYQPNSKSNFGIIALIINGILIFSILMLIMQVTVNKSLLRGLDDQLTKMLGEFVIIMVVGAPLLLFVILRLVMKNQLSLLAMLNQLATFLNLSSLLFVVSLIFLMGPIGINVLSISTLLLMIGLGVNFLGAVSMLFTNKNYGRLDKFYVTVGFWLSSSILYSMDFYYVIYSPIFNYFKRLFF
ncbi:hypothetical protein B808_809 [Fructilactobacillus florum 8D]|uniref:Zinc-ribbon domain-containing protein n=1 Tax=Fructilactobacillus florum 8D TaxID=1221538 RepID=W9EDW2_9LACO|nr:hypothetical protein B808_809 [Fructilactobacillus florum 8D]